jgi:hypothetical protein
VNEDSFERWHRPIAFFDPMSSGSPYVTFRRWKGQLPFDEIAWSRLRKDGSQEEKNMRSMDLVSESAFQEAVRLAIKAHETFDDIFNLNT